MIAAVPAAADVTLGLLGGAAGIDPVQEAARLLRFARRFPGETGPVLARTRTPMAAGAGITPVHDHPHLAPGPLADLAALVQACSTPWLLTLPVDVYDVNDCLLRTLARCSGADGAVAEDDDGLQPRVALYRTAALRAALAAMPAAAGQSLASFQQRLGLAHVRLAGVRFGHAAGAGVPLPVALLPPAQG